MKLCLTSPLDLLTTRGPAPRPRASGAPPRVLVVAFPKPAQSHFTVPSKLDGRATVPFRYRVRGHAPIDAS